MRSFQSHSPLADTLGRAAGGSGKEKKYKMVLGLFRSLGGGEQVSGGLVGCEAEWLKLYAVSLNPGSIGHDAGLTALLSSSVR